MNEHYLNGARRLVRRFGLDRIGLKVDELTASQLSKLINAAYNGGKLVEREREIVRKNYGLTGETPIVIREIAPEYCISEKRARQLRERAVDKMVYWVNQKFIKSVAK